MPKDSLRKLLEVFKENSEQIIKWASRETYNLKENTNIKITKIW